MLSDLGYRVLRAKDAQSALVVLESGAAVDLLFTDVVMPGPLRSPELAHKARALLPDIAVLFTSGYTENAVVHGGRLDEGVDLLSKPYTREALARKVREALQNARRRAAARPAAPAAVAPRPIAAAEGRAAARLRVLLVEDTALIRMATADMLAALGHAVSEAGNAAEALAILAAKAIDVLLTDIGLPDMSGEDLAVEARRRHPGLRIVFASGDTSGIGAGAAAQLADAIALGKPYDQEGLAAALQAVTAAGGAG
jgi:CheY-like chemotaxis protein